jgi:phage-related baseplate assembly protein
MTSPLSTIDLSLLPPPDVVEPIDFEVLLRAMLARLVANDPAFAEVLESDPAAKILEAVAYARMLDRQRVNEAARAVMLPYSRRNDLDNLGALWDTPRLQVGTAQGGKPVMEDDERYRRRIRLAAEAKGAAGSPGGYVFWALTFAPTATDASTVQLSPGSVAITLLGPGPDGQPLAAEVETVRRTLSDERTAKRPLTDYVSVAPAEVVRYAIEADIWLLPGPDAGLVMGKVNAMLTALLAERRKLGFDMPRSALLAALHQPGVSRVDLHQPAADVIITPRQVALPSGTPVVRVAGRAF